jgi:hypothetical protein
MNYSEVSAVEAFAFCSSRNWDSGAWSFWLLWRGETEDCRVRALYGASLGIPGFQESDRKFVLPDSTLAQWFETHPKWGDWEKQDFSRKLWGTI